MLIYFWLSADGKETLKIKLIKYCTKSLYSCNCTKWKSWTPSAAHICCRLSLPCYYQTTRWTFLTFTFIPKYRNAFHSQIRKKCVKTTMWLFPGEMTSGNHVRSWNSYICMQVLPVEHSVAWQQCWWLFKSGMWHYVN